MYASVIMEQSDAELLTVPPSLPVYIAIFGSSIIEYDDSECIVVVVVVAIISTVVVVITVY